MANHLLAVKLHLQNNKMRVLIFTLHKKIIDHLTPNNSFTLDDALNIFKKNEIIAARSCDTNSSHIAVVILETEDEIRNLFSKNISAPADKILLCNMTSDQFNQLLILEQQEIANNVYYNPIIPKIADILENTIADDKTHTLALPIKDFLFLLATIDFNRINFILMLIYIARFVITTNSPLNKMNIQHVILTSLLIAIKWLGGEKCNIEDFASLICLSLQQIQSLECEFLAIMQNHLFISEELYKSCENNLKNSSQNTDNFLQSIIEKEKQLKEEKNISLNPLSNTYMFFENSSSLFAPSTAQQENKLQDYKSTDKNINKKHKFSPKNRAQSKKQKPSGNNDDVFANTDRMDLDAVKLMSTEEVERIIAQEEIPDLIEEESGTRLKLKVN